MRVKASERAGVVAGYTSVARGAVADIIDGSPSSGPPRIDWATRVRVLLTAATVGTPLVRIDDYFRRVDLRTSVQSRAMAHSDAYFKHFDSAIKPLLPRSVRVTDSSLLTITGEAEVCAFACGSYDAYSDPNEEGRIVVLNCADNLMRWTNAWARHGAFVTREDNAVLTPGAIGGTFRIIDGPKSFHVMLAESTYFQQLLAAASREGTAPMWIGSLATRQLVAS